MTTKAPPYFRADYEIADASALQALAAGTADGEQQKRALKWIIEKGCGTYQVSFQPGSPDATAFAEGRRFVGTELVKLVNISTRDLMLREQEKRAQSNSARGSRT